MPAPLTPPLTDAELNEIGANPPVMGGWPAGRLLADDRWHRAELAKAQAKIERLRKNVEHAIDWFSLKHPELLADHAISHAGGVLCAALAPEGKERT